MDKELLSKQITVRDKQQFENAVSSGYGLIKVQGGFKDEIIKAYNDKKKADNITNVTLVIGILSLLWPLLLGGSVSKVFTKQIANYKIQDDNGNISFVHKKYKGEATR